jgi:hypothetical protein
MRSAYESVAWEAMTSKSVSLSKIWLLLQVLPLDAHLVWESLNLLLLQTCTILIFSSKVMSKLLCKSHFVWSLSVSVLCACASCAINYSGLTQLTDSEFT